MEDKNTGELFAACPVEHYPGGSVEAVTDSSRYFVICIKVRWYEISSKLLLARKVVPSLPVPIQGFLIRALNIRIDELFFILPYLRYTCRKAPPEKRT